MPVVTAVYATYAELNDGRVSTIAEFRERLSLLPRTGLLRLCSLIQCLLGARNVLIDRTLHDLLVRRLFAPQIAASLLEKREDHRFVFHRQQLLFLAKEAVRFCSKDMPPERELKEVGSVFLMANDQLQAAFGDPADVDRHVARAADMGADDDLLLLITFFIPHEEAAGLHPYQYRVLRSHVIVSYTARELDKRPWFDIPRLFREATGIELENYEALVNFALMRFDLGIVNYVKEPERFGLDERWFAAAEIPASQIERFIADVSATPDDYEELLKKKGSGINDFTCFRDRPLLNDDGVLYLMDSIFLTEKLETGPFWRIHGELPAAKRSDFHSFWGLLFEKYTNDLLGKSVDGKANVFHASPKYTQRPNEEVCDGLILCGSGAVFMEFKGNTFTAKAKYCGDPLVLGDEIEKKLISNGKGRKGIGQLADAINSLFARGAKESIAGVRLRNISEIYPLLITRDDIGSTMGVNALLNRKFRKLVDRKNLSRSVAPLLCMCASDLEKVSAYLIDTRFSDILRARYKLDKSLVAPFFARPNSIIQKKGDRLPKQYQRSLNELSNLIMQKMGKTVTAGTPGSTSSQG